MQNYQLTVLVKNDLDEKARALVLESLTKQFDKLDKQDLWGNRGLSYPIKHQTAAFYAHFEFQQEQSKISALDKNLKLNEDVIRFLLTRKEDKKIRASKSKKMVEVKAEPEKTVEVEEKGEEKKDNGN